jgi:hypothetical protein
VLGAVLPYKCGRAIHRCPVGELLDRDGCEGEWSISVIALFSPYAASFERGERSRLLTPWRDQNNRRTAAITAPHFSALPIARLSRGHSERSVRAQ